MASASHEPEPGPDAPKRSGESQLDYLHRLLEQRLSSRTSSARWYRRANFWTQMATTLLSAVITVVAGAKAFTFELTTEQLSDIVLVLGALVTVTAAYGAFYSPRELWVVDSLSSNKLRALQARLRYQELATDFADKKQAVVDAAFEEYQAIMAAYNEEWQRIRAVAR